jgi:Domain of unknown function (DUF4440)
VQIDSIREEGNFHVDTLAHSAIFLLKSPAENLFPATQRAQGVTIMLRYGIRLSVSLVTFFLGLALSFAPSLLSSDAPKGNAFEREVLEVNRQYLEAHINRNVAALDRLLADDFTIGGRFGRRVTGKAQRLALLTDSDFSFVDIDSSETRVTVSENTGEVSGYAVLRGIYAGREYTSPPYHYTRRFERRNGRWQVVSVETGGSKGSV